MDHVTETAGAVQIEEARIIVAGGRGMGGADGFRVAEELAGELGGAVAASRAAVDAGWIPYSRQVGQTGKIVKPEVYVALGISGAVQHKVGMQGAHTIIAINTDPTPRSPSSRTCSWSATCSRSCPRSCPSSGPGGAEHEAATIAPMTGACGPTMPAPEVAAARQNRGFAASQSTPDQRRREPSPTLPGPAGSRR